MTTHRRVLAGLAMIAAILSLLLASSAFATGSVGTIDRGFAHGGRLIQATSAERGDFWFAHSQGRLVVLAGSTVFAYDRDGHLDRSFGKDGTLLIEPPDNAKFDPAGVAIDSHGRIVVAGSAVGPQPEHCHPTELSPESTVPAIGFSPSLPIVYRFKANGRHDPAFADHGVLRTAFNLPFPSVADSITRVACDAVSISVTGLALDSKDQPVLAGEYVFSPVGCSSPSRGTRGAFVTRGNREVAFNDGRALTVKELHGASHPIVTPSGRIVFFGIAGARCAPRDGYARFAVASFDEDAEPSMGFGSEGWKAIGGILPYEGSMKSFTYTPVGAIDAKGRVLLLQEQGESDAFRLVRLRPDGRVDHQFESRRIADFDVSAIAVDGRGRILLAGSRSLTKGSAFALLRLRPNGSFDGSFGRHGKVITSFGRNVYATPSTVMFASHGTILVAGPASTGSFSYGKPGFAVSRYHG